MLKGKKEKSELKNVGRQKQMAQHHQAPPFPFPSPSTLPPFRPFPPFPLQQQQQGCTTPHEEPDPGSIVNEDPSLPPPLTLLVKHLPEALSSDTLLRLFSHYGATHVRLCSPGRLKNCAFVDFKDESQAARAQAQLHRLCFLGKMLCVERARPCPTKKVSEELSSTKVKENLSLPLQEGQSLLSIGSSAKATAKSSIYKAEPIAPSLGVDYPFAPHLEYAYPPPDGNILTNIVNALIAVPRFYTQVLHLMNKMNLPAPFRAALPTPPLPSVPPPPAPAPPPLQPQDLSSDESELESSEESGPNVVHNGAEGGQTSEMGVDEGSSSRKRRREEKRIEKFVASATSGAKPTQLIPKEKPIIKKRSTVLQINITSKGLISGGVQDKADVASENFSDSMNDEIVKPRNYATKEELEAGRMPLPEIHALPMFKNYTLGNPSPVLYIKNLAKEVVQDDLYYVFGAMFGNVEETKSKISIKLMQEGRMRGQAFVTFPSEKLAGDALNAVHAYVLKGKPMIVQFGRNPSKPIVDSTV